MVERELKMLCRLVFINEIQFGFMPESGTNFAVFILKVARRVSWQSEKVAHVSCGPREIIFHGDHMAVTKLR